MKLKQILFAGLTALALAGCVGIEKNDITNIHSQNPQLQITKTIKGKFTHDLEGIAHPNGNPECYIGEDTSESTGFVNHCNLGYRCDFPFKGFYLSKFIYGKRTDESCNTPCKEAVEKSLTNKKYRFTAELCGINDFSSLDNFYQAESQKVPLHIKAERCYSQNSSFNLMSPKNFKGNTWIMCYGNKIDFKQKGE